MQLQVYNENLIDFSLTEFLPKITAFFDNTKDTNVNIIFVDAAYIQELNKQYRAIDSITDVLSFNIDTDELLGEIYICPQYIANTHPEIPQKEEILRLIIHGLLHLTGYDHSVELTDATKKTEPMFVKQEQMLDNVLS